MNDYPISPRPPGGNDTYNDIKQSFEQMTSMQRFTVENSAGFFLFVFLLGIILIVFIGTLLDFSQPKENKNDTIIGIPFCDHEHETGIYLYHIFEGDQQLAIVVPMDNSHYEKECD